MMMKKFEVRVSPRFDVIKELAVLNHISSFLST